MGFASFALLVAVARWKTPRHKWLDAFTLATLLFVLSGFVPPLIAPLLSLAKLQAFRMTIWWQFAGGLYIARYIWMKLCDESNWQRNWGVLLLASFVIGAYKMPVVMALGVAALLIELAPRGKVWQAAALLASSTLCAVLLLVLSFDACRLLVALCVVVPLVLLAQGRARFALACGTLVSIVSGFALLSAWQPTRWPSTITMLTLRVQPHQQLKGSDGEAARWTHDNTPADAVILIPPYLENFRWQAQRAIVADFKTFPWSDAGMLEWRRRIYDLCGGRELHFGNTPYPVLAQAYQSLTPSQIRALSQRYSATFVLLPHAQKFDARLVYENRDWRIYALR